MSKWLLKQKQEDWQRASVSTEMDAALQLPQFYSSVIAPWAVLYAVDLYPF